jgi:phospholipase/carboxylesterase
MTDPHGHTPVSRLGADIAHARSAVVLLHGRGGTADDILNLAREMYDERVAYLAPQAAGNTWYPYSFLAPIEQNEPWLSSALARVASIVESCTSVGIPLAKIALCGFSQGACLATEFVARHAGPYGRLVALTGGLIGPPGSDLHHEGSLAGMAALFSSGDPDPHVPWSRVEASARQLERMGAQVQLTRYPGRMHTILPTEVEAAKGLISGLL